MTGLELLERPVASAFYGRFPVLLPVQEATIEPLLAGRNVVVSSGTGSGKTEAVLAPLVSRLWREAVESDAMLLLYLAPTRALVNDLEKRLLPPLATLGLRIGIRHGDRDDLSRGVTPHFLVTTPESLDVLLFRKERALKSVRAVVIDEVHLLYNTQRGLQLSILLQRLRRNLLHSFQWAALSATIAQPSDIRDFLFGPSEDVAFVQGSPGRMIDAQVRHIRAESEFLELILKLTASQPTKLLVFANSRRECERLAGILQAREQLRPFVFTHYSSLSPQVRVDTEEKFSALRTAICIATSTLELGIDIGDIDATVLWGAPGGVESFLQRIGRGNRRSQKTNVVCLVPDDSRKAISDAVRFLALIDAAKKGEMSACAPYQLYGAVGQQYLSIVASEGGQFTRVTDLLDLVRGKDYLDRESVELVLSELTEKGYLQRHGFKHRYGAGEELYPLVDYRLIYGNFGVGSQAVEVRHKSKVLGEVPVINLLRVRPGHVVRFAGRNWRVAQASTDGIILDPIHAKARAVDFVYPGARIQFDPYLTQSMWRLLHAEAFPSELLAPRLRELVTGARDRLRKACRATQIPYIRLTGGISYLTFAGYIVNKAVCINTGQLDPKFDDVLLTGTAPIEWNAISPSPRAYENIFDQLFESSSEQSLYQTLLPERFQVQEFLEGWLRDRTIPEVLQRLSSSAPVQVPPNVFQDWATVSTK